MIIAFNHEIRIKKCDYDKYASTNEFIFKIERTKDSPGFYKGDYIEFITGYVHVQTLKVEIIGVDILYENNRYYFVVHVKKVV